MNDAFARHILSPIKDGASQSVRSQLHDHYHTGCGGFGEQSVGIGRQFCHLWIWAREYITPIVVWVGIQSVPP